MADFFLSNLKSTLDNCITELDEIPSMFCRNPESDFTRNRKLSLYCFLSFAYLFIKNVIVVIKSYLSLTLHNQSLIEWHSV